MIDVVFLLLVFFMLAARFEQNIALPLATAAGGKAEWQGPPRLVEILPETVLLNGAPVAESALDGDLRALLPAPEAPVLLRAATDTDLSRLVAVIDVLRAAGLTRLIVVE